MEPFVRQEGITYPVAMSTPALERAYGGIRGLPTTFLIDRKGRIAKKFVGYLEKKRSRGRSARCSMNLRNPTTSVT